MKSHLEFLTSLSRLPLAAEVRALHRRTRELRGHSSKMGVPRGIDRGRGRRAEKASGSAWDKATRVTCGVRERGLSGTTAVLRHQGSGGAGA